MLIVLVFFIFIELTILCLISYLRNKFQWLILDQFDFFPVIKSEKISSFLKLSHDEDLGWIRKPSTKGSESARSFGQAPSESDHFSEFSINTKGNRTNPDFEEKAEKIITFGDSYTFCRQVNDDQTWQHYLSIDLNSNVTNSGVGNYGFDQALLRLEREHSKYPNSETIIIGIVPETITRILSSWKHYYEYGNLLAIKPIFYVDKNVLKLSPAPTNIKESLENLSVFSPSLNKYDYWYKKKFSKDVLRFPYSLSLIKKSARSIPIMKDLIMGNRDQAWTKVLKANCKFTINSYSEPYPKLLFKLIIERFDRFCRDQGKHGVIAIFPYLNDLKEINTGNHYYRHFFNSLKLTDTKIIDFSEEFLKVETLKDLYTNDFYGGHLSPLGNKIVATKLYNYLSSNNEKID